MSVTILCRRGQESFEVPSLPGRRAGLDLRESLARFCSPVTIHLGPGERVIDGRVYYSAAWLGAGPCESEPADGDDKPKEEKMDVTVRFTLEGRGDEQNTAEWIARLVAQLLREEGMTVGERGVGVRASRSRTAHANVQEETAA